MRYGCVVLMRTTWMFPIHVFQSAAQLYGRVPRPYNCDKTEATPTPTAKVASAKPSVKPTYRASAVLTEIAQHILHRLGCTNFSSLS